MRAGSLILIVLAIAGSAGCENNNPVIPTAPAVITDTFNGTLGPEGRNAHAFTVQEAGGLDVLVITLSPDPAIPIGIGLGSPAAGGGCTLRLKNDAAHQSSLISASVTVAGSYCLAVYDVGGIAADTTTDYVITLSHF